MKDKYVVEKPSVLMDFLINDMERPRKKAKQLLTNEAVLVNNVTATKYNRLLVKGDIVSLKGFNASNIDPRVEIIYEDKDIVVVNKPSGMLTISTENEKERTLYHIVSEYIKVTNKSARIFIIHRLDKETSGIIMFAKNENVKALYQNSWDSLVTYRGYVALVEGYVEKETGNIVQYLIESEDGFKVYYTKKDLGKKAITLYKVISRNDKYSLLDVEIQTGRKNQIRVAMQYIDHPVVGDYKYGSKDKIIKRLGLHAHKLIITNPISKKEMTFEAKVPKEFYKVSKNKN